jgi:hypothetical protein
MEPVLGLLGRDAGGRLEHLAGHLGPVRRAGVLHDLATDFRVAVMESRRCRNLARRLLSLAPRWTWWRERRPTRWSYTSFGSPRDTHTSLVETAALSAGHVSLASTGQRSLGSKSAAATAAADLRDALDRDE